MDYKLFVTLCFYFVLTNTKAQWPNETYSIKQLSVNEGLSHSDVIAMAQDDQGYLWIGTNNGLNRFDGRRVKTYKSNPLDSLGLPDSKISRLYTDKQGLLWIGTQHHGLCYYDSRYDKFTPVAIQADTTAVQNKTRYESLRISAMEEDGQGVLWVAAKDKGIFLIDITNSNQIEIRDHIFPEAAKSLLITSITFITPHEVVLSSYSGLFYLNRETGDFSRINLPMEMRQPAVHVNENGEVWIGGSEGLYLLKLREDNKLPPILTKITLSEPVKNITKIYQDKKGDFWLGTLGQGVYRIESSGKTGCVYGSVKCVAGSDVSETFVGGMERVNCFFEDKYGILWIGTSAGGAGFINGNQHFKKISNEHDLQLLPANYVNAVYATNSCIWVGTRNGLSLIHPNRKPQLFFAGLQITAIYEDHRGEFWIGTSAGLKCMVFRGNTFMEYVGNTTLNPLKNTQVTAISEDFYNRLWIGTFNQGIRILSADRRSVESMDENRGHLSSNMINNIYRDPMFPAMWISTRNAGVDRIVLDGGKQVGITNYSYETDQTGLSSNFTWPVKRSNDSTIWIGTLGGGLNRFTKHRSGAESFQYYTIADGLVDNDIEAIEIDRGGNLWLAGYGITKFDPTNNSIQFFDHNDGLQSNAFKVSASHQDKNGLLYFGGVNGLNFFSPDSVGINASKPDIVLTGLKIFNEEVKPGRPIHGKNILQQAIDFTKELVLPASLNDFTIDFTGIQFAEQGKIKYHYQLDGYNEKYTETNLPAASFSNLKAGSYLFKVRASFNGVSSDEKSIAIHVLPPWWQTWWAFIIYALLLIMVFIVYRRIITKENNLKNELLLAEKDKSLNQEKLEFFTNISHELKTPLSLIYSPMMELLQSEGNLTGNSAREKLWLIYRNSERLMALANQLIDFKKMESGQLTLHAAKGDIVKFIREIWLLFKHQAESAAVSYHLSTEKEAVDVYFDREKMQLVFSNLLMNAFKYTASGGVVHVNIYIKGEEAKDAEFEPNEGSRIVTNNFLEIVVEDNGIGIPEAELERIFDVHYHVATSNSLKSTGTGLGLSIAKGVMEKHGGFIRAESRLEKGSRFIVGIPFGKAHLPVNHIIDDYSGPDDMSHYASENNVMEVPEWEETTNPTSIPTYTLMIVEDNAALLNYLRDCFVKTFKVITAKNGSEGYEKAQMFLPDLIISDVMMPVLDGLELCKKLKGNPETDFIPVILLTARTAALYELEGIETGADDYVSKPFNIRLLSAKVNNFIHNRMKVKEYYAKLMTADETRPAINAADEAFIHRIIGIVESNLQNKDFGVLPLASEMAMSKSALFKRLKDISGSSPVDFIRSIRMRRAEQLLLENQLTVSDVAFEVGISDVKYFREQFKKRNGVSPSEYMQKHRKISESAS